MELQVNHHHPLLSQRLVVPRLHRLHHPDVETAPMCHRQGSPCCMTRGLSTPRLHTSDSSAMTAHHSLSRRPCSWPLALRGTSCTTTKVTLLAPWLRRRGCSTLQRRTRFVGASDQPSTTLSSTLGLDGVRGEYLSRAPHPLLLLRRVRRLQPRSITRLYQPSTRAQLLQAWVSQRTPLCPRVLLTAPLPRHYGCTEAQNLP